MGEIVDFPRRQRMRTDTQRVTVTLPVLIVEQLKKQAERQNLSLAHLIARRLGADDEQQEAVAESDSFSDVENVCTHPPAERIVYSWGEVCQRCHTKVR
jgi:hypothetical protein